ncbi:hypothetical protein SDC9_64766 [bioreactor metagenome]|uniref:Uncharacterized protein n=2 Tax=root TaxID=1 RepID=R9CEV9_9CLOT|nr:hypothetical protein [Clostridium sartagoforme]EOR27869.1 hypothetical protein A500_02381 [Clostridium sartagoforme AAU1]
MKNIFYKVIVFTILIALVGNISISVSAKSINNNQLTINSNATLMSKELIEKADKYVNIKNGEFVLDNSAYRDSVLSESEIQEVKLNIVNSNNLLKGNNNNSVNSEEKSIKISFSDQQMNTAFEKYGINVNDISAASAEVSGVNQVVTYWWGYYIYLDSYYTELAFYMNQAALAAAFSSLFPYLRITQALATVMIIKRLWERFWGSGCVVSWNTALGYQDSWSQ